MSELLERSARDIGERVRPVRVGERPCDLPHRRTTHERWFVGRDICRLHAVRGGRW